MLKRTMLVYALIGMMVAAITLPWTRDLAVTYGTVTLNGQPAEGCTIAFVREGEARGSLATVRIGRDGKYWLVMPKGRHRVRITSLRNLTVDASPLAVVESGLNVLAFDCDAKPR